MTAHHRIIPAAAVALTLAAGAAPAASRYEYLGAAQSPGIRAGTQPLRQVNNVSAPPATVVRVTPGNSGFDWGDAGIGAAGGLALSLVALGGGLAFSERSGRRTRHGTA
jgi:hypothetical protein